MTEREVIIDDRTTILTKSNKSDEEVRKAFLDKLSYNKNVELRGNKMGRPSFSKAKGNYGP